VFTFSRIPYFPYVSPTGALKVKRSGGNDLRDGLYPTERSGSSDYIEFILCGGGVEDYFHWVDGRESQRWREEEQEGRPRRGKDRKEEGKNRRRTIKDCVSLRRDGALTTNANERGNFPHQVLLSLRCRIPNTSDSVWLENYKAVTEWMGDG